MTTGPADWGQVLERFEHHCDEARRINAASIDEIVALLTGPPDELPAVLGRPALPDGLGPCPPELEPQARRILAETDALTHELERHIDAVFAALRAIPTPARPTNERVARFFDAHG